MISRCHALTIEMLLPLGVSLGDWGLLQAAKAGFLWKNSIFT